MPNLDFLNNFPIHRYVTPQGILLGNETSLDYYWVQITLVDLAENWKYLLVKFKEETDPFFFVNVGFANRWYLLKMIFETSTQILHITNDEDYQLLSKFVGQTFKRRIKHLAEYIKAICQYLHYYSLSSTPEEVLQSILLTPALKEFSFSWNVETPFVCNLEKCYNGISTELTGE